MDVSRPGRRPAGVVTVLLALVLLHGCVPLASRQTPASQPQQPPPPRCLLLKHGWDMPSMDRLARNPDLLSRHPFAGVMLDSPLRDRVFAREALTDAQAGQALEPYCGVPGRESRHDLLLLLASHTSTNLRPPDFLASWQVVRDNLAAVADAAREAGLRGLAFDNEPYGVNWFALDAAMTARADADTWSAAAFARGSEVMSTLEEHWPGAVLMVFLGPGVSVDRQGRLREPFPLLGPFYAGMVAARRQVRFIDGGENYRLETPEQFAAFARAVKHPDPSRYPFLPPDLAARWPGQVEAAFGVYDRAFNGIAAGDLLEPMLLHQRLADACNATEGYVWLYTEVLRWWDDDTPPPPAYTGLVGTLPHTRWPSEK